LLDELFVGALADAALRSESTQSKHLELAVESMVPALDALQRLRSASFVSVIAEIKRASPSRGKLADIENPGELASIYEGSGAAAISVLTEARRFLGSLADLAQVRAQTSVPLLRKDFIASEYQILEARVHGADMVLLIATWLPPKRLAELLQFASGLGMTSLVETHSEQEIDSAVTAGAQLIGINTRDLETFQTDIGIFERLSSRLPENALKVAESAVKTRDDIVRYRDAGADAVLIGEALVTGDAARLLEEFTSVSI